MPRDAPVTTATLPASTPFLLIVAMVRTSSSDLGIRVGRSWAFARVLSPAFARACLPLARALHSAHRHGHHYDLRDLRYHAPLRALADAWALRRVPRGRRNRRGLPAAAARPPQARAWSRRPRPEGRSKSGRLAAVPFARPRYLGH